MLAHYFISQFNKKIGKNITGINEQELENMRKYHWPGNIRELENIIERGALLSKGNIIDNLLIPVSHQNQVSMATQSAPVKTIGENEHDHIINVLKNCNGRIWGPEGAAAVLKIPPTTLKSKIKKLGIQKENFAYQ